MQSISFLAGPEYQSFSKADITTIQNTSYTISNYSNRMGIRLEGSSLLSVKDQSIISSALLPGTIQVPPSGLPIISAYDGGTTGGYPRLVILPESELNKIAQKRPGEKIFFKKVG